MIAGTLQTDPRSGGIKRSSDVNVLPIVAETWSQVRDDTDLSVDWLIAGYDDNSKTDITVLGKGVGGIDSCSRSLPEQMAVFGGCRLQQSGRFVCFFYTDEGTPVMQKGRASMHKNGVLNILEGCDGEIEMKRGLLEKDTALPVSGGGNTNEPSKSKRKPATPQITMPASTTSKEEPEKEPAQPIASASPAVKETVVEELIGGDSSLTVAYAQLKDVKDVSDLPAGVDPLNREKSLSDQEFFAVFGVDKDTFYKQPAWKRTNLKKTKGLF